MSDMLKAAIGAAMFSWIIFTTTCVLAVAAHYDDRDHSLRSIATTGYDRLRPV